MIMYNAEQFSIRLAQLRMEKGVSARTMSIELGQNVSYINRIENGKAMPSLNQFFNICEYLDISPSDFFNEEKNHYTKSQELYKETEKLTPDMAKNFLEIIKRINEKTI